MDNSNEPGRLSKGRSSGECSIALFPVSWVVPSSPKGWVCTCAAQMLRDFHHAAPWLNAEWLNMALNELHARRPDLFSHLQLKPQ